MKYMWYLTRLYISKHYKQQVVFSLAMCLFATIILSTLFLSECFFATNRQLTYEYYGHFGGQSILAEKEKMKPLENEIKECQASVVPTLADITVMEEGPKVYLGYMDDSAREMKAVRVKEGNFPSNDSEIAVDETAYYRLNLSANIGEKVSLPIRVNGVEENKEFVLVGILYDYADHWNKMAQNFLLQVGQVNETDPQLPAALTGPGNSETAIGYTVLYPEGASPLEVGGKLTIPMETLSGILLFLMQNHSSAMMNRIYY